MCVCVYSRTSAAVPVHSTPMTCETWRQGGMATGSGGQGSQGDDRGEDWGGGGEIKSDRG